MLNSAFDIGEDLTLRKLFYFPYPMLWERYTYGTFNFSKENWNTIKYLNNEGTELSAEVEDIPADLGGLYMFVIKCPTMPGITEYLGYIGRAQSTDHQNLRKRCKEYFQKYAKSNERPKITRLFKYWSTFLYLSYMPIGENADTADLEKKLINSLIPPFNDQIPDIEISQAVKAFQ